MPNSHAKAIWDMSERSVEYSKLLSEVHIRGVGFGSHNAELLSRHGIEDVLIASNELPEAYRNASGDRIWRADRHGRRINGISTWWHKLEAIRIAMEANPKPYGIIWLDWDCITRKKPDDGMVSMLESGPSVQGCNSFYPMGGRTYWRGPGREKNTFFNGGCYYIRDLEFVYHAIKIHADRFPSYADEMPVTWLIDHEIGDSAHNPRFFTCRRQEPPGTDRGYFREGRHIRVDKFLKLMEQRNKGNK